MNEYFTPQKHKKMCKSACSMLSWAITFQGLFRLNGFPNYMVSIDHHKNFYQNIINCHRYVLWRNGCQSRSEQINYSQNIFASIVLVMCTGNSLAAKCIPNSSRQAETNSRTAQKMPACTIEKVRSCQKLASWLVSTWDPVVEYVGVWFEIWF